MAVSKIYSGSQLEVEQKINEIIDALADSAQLNYYGTCATAAATQAKVVDCEGFVLKIGVSIRVKFTDAQKYNGAPTLNVNSTGAISVKSIGTTNSVRYCWLAGEIVSFTYDGTYWVMEDAGIASTAYYGYTKLTTSAYSTSSSTALTPVSLNNYSQYMVSGAPVYSSSATYEIGDRVRYDYQTWECNTAITTPEAWNAEHWTALDPLQTQINNKQDKLVSAINIKTINNQSLLGSGNINIEGSGSGDVFLAEYDVSTYTEIETAYNAGIAVFVRFSSYTVPLISEEGGFFKFGGLNYDESISVTIDDLDNWNYSITFLAVNGNYEYSTRKVTSLSPSSTNIQYPSAKCVYDEVYYREGETISGSIYGYGHLTSSKSNLYISVPLGKRIPDTYTINITSLSLQVRGAGGTVSVSDNSWSTLEVTITNDRRNMTLILTSSSLFSSMTNNSCYEARCTITGYVESE